jgi:hypothetical protein
MILKAQQMQHKMGLEEQKIKVDHGKLLLEADKSEKDFSSKIAQVLSSIHQHNNPQSKN